MRLALAVPEVSDDVALVADAPGSRDLGQRRGKLAVDAVPEQEAVFNPVRVSDVCCAGVVPPDDLALAVDPVKEVARPECLAVKVPPGDRSLPCC